MTIPLVTFVAHTLHVVVTVPLVIFVAHVVHGVVVVLRLTDEQNPITIEDEAGVLSKDAIYVDRPASREGQDQSGQRKGHGCTRVPRG